MLNVIRSHPSNTRSGELAFAAGFSHSWPLQMKLHELKRFPLSCLDLLSVASCQAVFSFGNLVKLKCHT